VYIYRQTLPRGGVAELIVHRHERAETIDAREICDRLVRPHTSILGTLLGRQVPVWSRENLGPWDAVQLHHPVIPMVARASVLPDEEVYAVTLRVEDGTMDDGLYRAFDTVCRSIVHHPRPGPLFLRPAPGGIRE
jgi:hypothetical protein